MIPRTNPKERIENDERIDDLNRCGYKIIQNTKKFCFGIDAVLLSGFAKASKGDKVVDLELELAYCLF